MTTKSKGYRKKAADHLKTSRKSTTTADKDHQTFMAVRFKNLADSEEWVHGEPRRSKTPRDLKPKE
jgi:hypothetical protein